MNVLILTPDRVGSTLLQRLITVYMLRREFDRPVINLHELTNGLKKYYNITLNQEVLGKPQGTEWGYFQSLKEIEDLLKSTNHYKTSRLAHYHLIRRKDSIEDQIKFYNYLNENFFIISCRRDNILDYALSWAINGHSKVLNVYEPIEKINIFETIYKNGITVNKETLENYLSKYKQYVEWTDTYFNVQSYFNYDKDVHNIEDYILNLDFMQGHSSNTWKDMFGQNFLSWNTCHRMLPNLKLNKKLNSTHQISYPTKLLSNTNYNILKGTSWPSFIDETVDNIKNSDLITQEINQQIGVVTANVSNQEYTFLSNNLKLYIKTNSQLLKLVEDGFLVSNIPLKLQSLGEKKKIIKNFNQCVDWINNWIVDNEYGSVYSESDIDKLITEEEKKLNKVVEECYQLTLTPLTYHNDDHP